MHGYLRQSTAATVKVGPFLAPSDGVTPATALTAPAAAVSGASSGVALDTNGTLAGYTLSGWAHDRLGYYTANLSTADTGTVGRLKIVFIDPANYAPVEITWTVLSQAVYDVLFGTVALSTYAGGLVPANVTEWGGSAVTGMPLPTGSYVAPDNTDIVAALADIAAVQSSVGTGLGTLVAAVKAKTDNLPSSPAAVGSAMTVSGYATGQDPGTQLLDLANGIETGETPRQFFRTLRAWFRGVVAPSSGQAAFKRKDGTTTSFTESYDSSGNRTASVDGTN